MPRTVTLNDVRIGAITVVKDMNGTWHMIFDYAVIDTDGNAYSHGGFEWTPGANAQTNLTNIAAQAVTAIKTKEGL